VTIAAGDVLVVTHFPSPYQVELFDEASRQRADRLIVAYLHSHDRARSWAHVTPAHRALYLADAGDRRTCDALNRSAALVVFNYYQDRRAIRLIRARAQADRPWAFWGERPGFHQEMVGRLARKFALNALHGSPRPIWGIGQWAVDAYRREFGGGRSYENLPYFSDLSRYAAVHVPPPVGECTFVYAGSLMRRKGVDLLAAAFVKLAGEFAHVRLRVVGGGELEKQLQQIFAPVHNQVEMRGFKDWRDMPSAYAGGHVLCVPSRYDGWALVVPEGLAAGLPVIATRRTGAALELIRTPVNGWLIDADDERALYEAMRAAAQLTRSEWQAMSDAARSSVAAHTLSAGAERLWTAADAAMAEHVAAEVR
jgi:glycosyltransferase involved in cell wall biosynthesis